MCLSPINIINPSKFVSLSHRERYVLSVPCGRCSECQQKRSNEWYYRAKYEFDDTVANGGYVLFDTLTYSNEFLPHMSRYISDLPNDLDFPCFSHDDFRLFFVRLRTKLKRDYGFDPNGRLKYFLASEYGTSPNSTHRPHYHILLYVRDSSLDPLTLSKCVSECWYFGRTDGVPYQSGMYVLNNRVYRSGFVASNFVSHYVTKYVQKSSLFSREVNRRVDSVMKHRASLECPDVAKRDIYLHSGPMKKLRRDLLRLCDQFHRQSQGFGVAALADIDLIDLFDTGVLRCSDSKSVVLTVPLPTYYKRKLFYELVSYAGVRSWQPTELGLKYLSLRQFHSIKLQADRFENWFIAHPDDEVNKLLDGRSFYQVAEYVQTYKGRLNGFLAGVTRLEDKVNYPLVFNYVTSCDKQMFGFRFVSCDWLGYKDNYFGYPDSPIRLDDFIRDNVLSDKSEWLYRDFDRILEIYYSSISDYNKQRQDLFDMKQRVSNVVKMLFV